MSPTIEIAKTIASQIGGRRLKALGAASRVALAPTPAQQGGLEFKASLFGRRQCLVNVALTHRDTYTVSVLKPRSRSVIARFDDIHCEELGAEIELAVETHFAN